MITTYIKSTSKAALEAMVLGCVNAIPICKGSAEQTMMIEGIEVTIPAHGDPNYYYACIRNGKEPKILSGVEICTKEECADVCGIWYDEASGEID